MTLGQGKFAFLKRARNNRRRFEARSSLEKAEWRRICKPGFPVERRLTFAEVEEYLTQESGIVCLLCGREFRSIGRHVHVIHGMTLNAYRDQFGLPYSRGLDCAEVRELRVNEGKRRLEEGIYQVPDPGSYVRRGPTQSVYRRAMNVEAGHKNKGRPGHNKTSEEVMHEFVRRVALGRSKRSVSQDPDMPGYSAFRKWELSRKDRPPQPAAEAFRSDG